jgi:antitoxin (DNA-binding transcriptional repressor) of toxin-antitoxin stability system
MSIEIDYQQFQLKMADYLNKVQSGEVVIVCKNMKPFAEIRPVAEARPLGLARGAVSFGAAAAEPLPEDVRQGFEGRSA